MGYLIMNATGTSSVVTTLYEKCQNTQNPFFTWELFRKSTQQTIIFYQNDVSPDPFYFNQFVLTVGTNSLGLTAGIIPVADGEWNYTIFEMISPYDLNLDHSQGVVEVGLLYVNPIFIPLTPADQGYVPLTVYNG